MSVNVVSLCLLAMLIFNFSVCAEGLGVFEEGGAKGGGRGSSSFLS